MEAAIADDLGADSLDVVDLVMSLEEEFNIEIPDEEVENIKTVGDIVKFIEEKLRNNSSSKSLWSCQRLFSILLSSFYFYLRRNTSVIATRGGTFYISKKDETD